MSQMCINSFVEEFADYAKYFSSSESSQLRQVISRLAEMYFSSLGVLPLGRSLFIVTSLLCFWLSLQVVHFVVSF